MAKRKETQLYNSRQLTKHLREFAADIETMDDDGNMITRGEALALLIWRKALGSESRDPKTNEITVHKPEAWAIQLIYERIEGKAPMALVDDRAQLSVAEKVSELVRKRLNKQAEAAIAVPQETEPVDRSDNGLEDSQESDS